MKLVTAIVYVISLKPMPVLKKIQTNDSEVCVWKITEGQSDFELNLQPSESTQAQRNIQWLAGRAALSALHVDVSSIQKDEFGKPHLGSNSHQISLSHCKKYAAAIKSNLSVGIDIEEITPRIDRIAKRFVHPNEWAFINESQRLEMLYLLWSGKEALYKLYGKKAVDFQNHMIAQPFELRKSGIFTMKFLKDVNESFIIQYEIFDGHTLVWVEGKDDV